MYKSKVLSAGDDGTVRVVIEFKDTTIIVFPTQATPFLVHRQPSPRWRLPSLF